MPLQEIPLPLGEMKTKYCPKCRTEKPISEFRFRAKKKRRLQSYCKVCCILAVDEYRKRLRKNNPKKLKDQTLRYRLKSDFDLTLDEYNKMFQKQKGLCAICGKPEIQHSRQNIPDKLSVDHNHNTRKIRGLLCHKCNHALGMLDVDNLGILNLLMATNYIRKSI